MIGAVEYRCTIIERIERLRAQMRNGDPDLAPNELDPALSKAEEKAPVAPGYPVRGNPGPRALNAAESLILWCAKRIRTPDPRITNDLPRRYEFSSPY
jgi:hypothetical protein